jgi:hypothetical protein
MLKTIVKNVAIVVVPTVLVPAAIALAVGAMQFRHYRKQADADLAKHKIAN